VLAKKTLNISFHFLSILVSIRYFYTHVLLLTNIVMQGSTACMA